MSSVYFDTITEAEKVRQLELIRAAMILVRNVNDLVASFDDDLDDAVSDLGGELLEAYKRKNGQEVEG